MCCAPVGCSARPGGVRCTPAPSARAPAACTKPSPGLPALSWRVACIPPHRPTAPPFAAACGEPRRLPAACAADRLEPAPAPAPHSERCSSAYSERLCCSRIAFSWRWRLSSASSSSSHCRRLLSRSANRRLDCAAALSAPAFVLGLCPDASPARSSDGGEAHCPPSAAAPNPAARAPARRPALPAR